MSRPVPVALRELGGRVQEVLRRRWAAAEVTAVEELPGGISSLTFAATVRSAAVPGGSIRVVVKVAPPGRRPVANRDVLRQARLLVALGGVAGTAVPAVLATDEGGGDGEPPLFVMEHVAGQSFDPAIDTLDEPPAPAVVRGRALAAARHLVTLQVVTPDLPGLGGEPIIGLAEEVERWRRLFATVGGPEEAVVADAAGIGADLAASVPEEEAPVLVHGDYRLGNMLFEGEDLRGVIDWEIWSFGDRRLDLAWLAVQLDALHRQTVTAPDAAHRAVVAALPSTADLVDAYVTAGGQPPGDLAWFSALADFKIGATLAVLLKQNRKRATPDPILASRAAGLTPTLDRARRHLATLRSTASGHPGTGP